MSCGLGYTCDETSHECKAIAGKELLRSINIRTALGCSACGPEGVSLQLLGEKNAQYLEGTPCNTSILDHNNTIDFGGGFGNWTIFNGTLDGHFNQEEMNMMGSCYEVGPEMTVSLIFNTEHFQAPLNAQLVGGELTWEGKLGDWSPLDVCVDWKSNNFAWLCHLYQTGPDTWNFTICNDLSPYLNCVDFYESQ